MDNMMRDIKGRLPSWLPEWLTETDVAYGIAPLPILVGVVAVVMTTILYVPDGLHTRFPSTEPLAEHFKARCTWLERCLRCLRSQERFLLGGRRSARRRSNEQPCQRGTESDDKPGFFTIGECGQCGEPVNDHEKWMLPERMREADAIGLDFSSLRSTLRREALRMIRCGNRSREGCRRRRTLVAVQRQCSTTRNSHSSLAAYTWRAAILSFAALGYDEVPPTAVFVVSTLDITANILEREKIAAEVKGCADGCVYRQQSMPDQFLAATQSLVPARERS